MKEFKFRAWDNQTNRFEYWNNKENRYDGIFWLMIKGPGFEEPEQYADHKDKNSKEIYKGDILKNGDVIMVVGWSKKFASFCLNRKGWLYPHYFGEAVDPEKCEIIGNIHENNKMAVKK